MNATEVSFKLLGLIGHVPSFAPFWFALYGLRNSSVVKYLHFPGCLIVVVPFCNTSSVKLVIVLYCHSFRLCVQAYYVYYSSVNLKKLELTYFDLLEQKQWQEWWLVKLGYSNGWQQGLWISLFWNGYLTLVN
jgi:hypothetical protein